jgi:uncharacterized protein YbjT (DUF2867 family)
MIVIAAPTSNIGRQVVDHLIESNAAVRVIAAIRNIFQPKSRQVLKS